MEVRIAGKLGLAVMKSTFCSGKLKCIKCINFLTNLLWRSLCSLWSKISSVCTLAHKVSNVHKEKILRSSKVYQIFIVIKFILQNIEG
jgi:hypothetical protein